MSTANSDTVDSEHRSTEHRHGYRPTNNQTNRFLRLCVLIGILTALPFYTHPQGLYRPDGWMFTVLNHLLPFLLLFWFHRPKVRLPSQIELKQWFVLGLVTEACLLGLLGWSVLLGELQLDWTFQGFKDWSEVQIGQQIEMTELPMPGMPADFTVLAKYTFFASFFAPWFLWLVCWPQEMVWRGWVVEQSTTVKDWMRLSTYWTLWQVPMWLLEPQWHWGWWQNNGSLFAQQLLSTWLIGIILCQIRHLFNGSWFTALMVALLTTSEVWAVMIQQTVPFPKWLWIGWNGWWGCMLMLGWVLWQGYQNKPSTTKP